MLRIRNRRLLVYGLPIILVIFAGDFIYGFIAQQKLARSPINLSVRAEKGSVGHNTIGIDEQTLDGSVGKRFLYFSTLGKWNFAVDSRPPCPKTIKALNGHSFDCVGFMYPLQTGDKIKNFCLLRSTQTCCYGPRPQFNQYILIEMKEPVKFQRLKPVIISGKFFVDPKPEDGYIYRMEGNSLVCVGDDVPDIDPVTSAKNAKLPLFDYAPLAAMAKNPKSDGVAQAIQSMDGKRVVVAGYCVGRNSAQHPKLIVGNIWWDGVAQGTPPTIYNAITVYPADESQMPPLWKPFQVFTGILQVTTDAARWNKDGIVQLRDAQLGVPGVTQPIGRHRPGPVIPLTWKLITTAILFALIFKWQKT